MNRRSFLTLLAAPAIVPFASLMPVRGIIMPIVPFEKFVIMDRRWGIYDSSFLGKTFYGWHENAGIHALEPK
jgi:hypothetical protein